MKITASYLDCVARDWQSAYIAANSKNAPAVVWEGGWFVIDGRRYRRAKLESMRDELRRRALAKQEEKND
jgi:hypothetical protein